MNPVVGIAAFAAVTLAAHLDKLAEEEALPVDVERPKFERTER